MSDDSMLYDQTMYILKMIFLAATVVTVVILTYVFSFQTIKTDVLEIQTLIEEVYSSPQILAYQEVLTKRAYPGIIDVEKFKTINLNEVIQTQRKDIVMKIKLLDANMAEIATTYFLPTKEPTEENYQIAEVIKKYPERATTLTEYPLIKHITILQNGEMKKGTLEFYVIKQR